MTKHVDYFEMVDAIKVSSVCPICYLVDRAVENYIDSFLGCAALISPIHWRDESRFLITLNTMRW